MFRKINSFLRVIVIITGVIAIIFKLTENKTVKDSIKHGYSTEVYDDIW